VESAVRDARGVEHAKIRVVLRAQNHCHDSTRCEIARKESYTSRMGLPVQPRSSFGDVVAMLRLRRLAAVCAEVAGDVGGRELRHRYRPR
jgi:hypothetical protein